MPINKLLPHDYIDDGVYGYKCLACYKEWGARGSDLFIFCPYCGIKFEGLQKNKKQERLDKIYEFTRGRPYKPFEPKFVLVIETRFIHRAFEDTPDNYISEWKRERVCLLISPFGRNNSKVIKSYLNELREERDSYYITLIRYRMEKYNMHKHGVVNSIWGNF